MLYIVYELNEIVALDGAFLVLKKTSNILAYFLHSFLQEDMARYRIDLAHNLLIHRMNNALKEWAFNEELVALFFGRFKTDKLLSSLV